MKHSITVDAVVRGITTAHCIDHSREIALLMENIIELQGNSQRLTLQETLSHLHIPDQFIGIHRCIIVSPTTLLVDIC